MSDATVIKKLRMKSGQRALILNAPGDYMAGLGILPDDLVVSTEAAAGEFDFVHVFARDSEELERFAPAAIAASKDDAVLWFSYPKRSSGIETDLSRDEGWRVVYAAGLRPVSQVSIDDVWSAVRFRSTEKVGKPWPPAERDKKG